MTGSQGHSRDLGRSQGRPASTQETGSRQRPCTVLKSEMICTNSVSALSGNVLWARLDLISNFTLLPPWCFTSNWGLPCCSCLRGAVPLLQTVAPRRAGIRDSCYHLPPNPFSNPKISTLACINLGTFLY